MQLIPFIASDTDCHLVDEFYDDAQYLRLELRNWKKVESQLNQKNRIWIDAGVDGIHHILEGNGVDSAWEQTFKSFRHFKEIILEKFIGKPNTTIVEEFVFDVLNACHTHKPKAISVPQLPFVNDTSRNRVNWALAKATAKWKQQSKFRGQMILPVILTHQRQLNLKTDRNKKINEAVKSFNNSEADGYWVIDSTMTDLDGQPIFRSKRFRGILDFNTEIQQALPAAEPKVAGPYWGLNLISWARGVATHPAVGVGRTYQYHISGGANARAPKIRIAIPPLRRWAIHSPQLKTWIGTNLKKYDKTSYAFQELNQLFLNFDQLRTKAASRRQLAKFYHDWYKLIEKASPAGRKLALFQDFSAAYVLGNDFSELPASDQPKQPERVAEYFMMFCL